jgi:hypothetical protein
LALALTQPLSETGIGDVSGGKARPVQEAGNLTAICEPILCKKLEASTFHNLMNLHGLLQGYICLLTSYYCILVKKENIIIISKSRDKMDAVAIQHVAGTIYIPPAFHKLCICPIRYIYVLRAIFNVSSYYFQKHFLKVKQ